LRRRTVPKWRPPLPNFRQKAAVRHGIVHSHFNPVGGAMSDKRKKQDGELSEQQLDRISGGQDVRKMGTIVVEAKRVPADPKVVKMETITVTAKRERHDVAGTQVASVSPKTSKN
jgi:hypothetical protein